MSKQWTEKEIVVLLEKNDKAVERAVVAIYNLQTNTEKSAESTMVLNDIGFAANDAPMGSYLAKWILSGKKLSGKFLMIARKMAIKYRKQLLEIALNGNKNGNKNAA